MVRLSFTRSGGLLAAPGLRVQASVTVETHGGEVVSAGGYWRTMDAEESGELIANLEAVSRELSIDDGPPSQTRDAFMFTFAIEIDDQRVEIDNRGSRQSSGLQQLVEWASREADAIIRRRTATLDR